MKTSMPVSQAYLQLLVVCRNRLNNCCVGFVWRKHHVPDFGNTVPSKHEARLHRALVERRHNTQQVPKQQARRRLYLGCTAVIICKMLSKGMQDMPIIDVYDVVLDMPTDTKATPASKTYT